MAGFGAVPKPAHLQRRPGRGLGGASLVRLPAGGRAGDPPRWPLPGRMTAAQRRLWAELWSTPQAVAWESLGWSRVVARYASLLLKAEVPRATAALLGEVRQLEDRLGLSPLAMLRLRWEIMPAEPVNANRGSVSATRGSVSANRGPASVASARERMRALVDDDRDPRARVRQGRREQRERILAVDDGPGPA